MNEIENYLDKHDPKASKEDIKKAIAESNIDFHVIIGEAHQLTMKEASQKKPHYIGRNWMAETFHGNIIGLFIDHFPEMMKVDQHGCHYLLLRNDIRIYFKKLDSKYRPSNVETKHVAQMWAQQLFTVENKVHILYVGYILQDDQWDVMKGVYGSYPSDFYGGKIAWVIDMMDFTKTIKMPLEVPQPDELTVTPKKIAKEKGETG